MNTSIFIIALSIVGIMLFAACDRESEEVEPTNSEIDFSTSKTVVNGEEIERD